MIEFSSKEKVRKEQLVSYVKSTLASILRIPEEQITNTEPIQTGLTNDSFVVTAGEKQYVFRLPGEGTSAIIDRKVELTVYQAVWPYDITEKLYFFDTETGVKISKYYAGSRTAREDCPADSKLAMDQLRNLHEKKLVIPNEFDVEGQMSHYTKLCEDIGAIHFSDFYQVKEQMIQLIQLKNSLKIPHVLCHGDPLPANVLILEDGTGKLIDWEYSGMSDPLMDVAMYGIFPYFDKEQMDQLLYFYCGGAPTKEEILRQYLYIALSGFLWSMWGSYQHSRGDQFQEYIEKMYGYAKDYYQLVQTML